MSRTIKTVIAASVAALAGGIAILGALHLVRARSIVAPGSAGARSSFESETKVPDLVNDAGGHRVELSNSLLSASWDKSSFVTCSTLGQVYVLDGDGEETCRLNLPKTAVPTCVALSTSGTLRVACGTRDGTLLLSTPGSSTFETLIVVEPGSLDSVAFNQSGDLVASTGMGGRLRITRTRTAETVFEARFASGVGALSWSRLDSSLFAAVHDIGVLRIDHRFAIGMLQNCGSESIVSMTSLGDGNLACGTIDGKVLQVSAMGVRYFNKSMPSRTELPLLSIDASGGGDLLAWMCGDRLGETWNRSDGLRLHKWGASSGSSNAVLFARSGATLLCADSEGKLVQISK